jgi:hypothetical protein
MDIFKKAYDWALTYNFSAIEIEYASKLALKMLDDSCKMDSHDRRVFFNVYDAICDRDDIILNDDINKLIVLARNRDSIYSTKEYAHIVHACRLEVIPSMLKVHMKAFKAMVRKNLGIN